MVRFYFRVILIALLIISFQNIFAQTTKTEAKTTTSVNATENTSNLSASTKENVQSDINKTINNEESQLLLDSSPSPEISIKPFGIWNTIKVFLVLILLLVFGAFVLLFFKKLQNPRPFYNSELIEIVSSKGLAQGNILYLIKIAKGFILIAQSNQNIQIIKEFIEKDDIDEINVSLSQIESKNESEKEKMTFYQKLQKKLSFSNVGIVNQNLGSFQSQQINNSINHAFSNNSIIDFFRKNKRKK